MNNHKVDSDLKKVQSFQSGVSEQGRPVANLGFALLFLVGVFLYAAVVHGLGGTSAFVIVAAVIGGYMAMNIGANDVANNIGPAVGSKALTMVGALVIAAVFEASGALLAGGDVVSTIRKGIIDPSSISDQMVFIWAMMSALLAAALWLNLATYVGAPVSTTHSIVGGVVGAGIAAAGASSVAWGKLAAIAASWVVSPLLGGIIAAAFLYFIKRNILWQDDMLAASRRWVPVLVAIMTASFTLYLATKGLSKVWKPDVVSMWTITGLVALATWLVTKPLVARRSLMLDNRRKSVASLFTIPLIISAALLSFAHGANDVANAVGPLAAIVSVATDSAGSGKIAIPLWVMVIGAIGISIGLMLFGPKLIRTVGEKITKLNQMRAFCVALAAAITVIAASWLGLPVSSTHIAVGGVFGVGFLREYIANSGADAKGRPTKKQRKAQAKRKLVRRREMLTIAAAWVITVPVAGLMSAGLFFVLYNVFEG